MKNLTLVLMLLSSTALAQTAPPPCDARFAAAQAMVLQGVGREWVANTAVQVADTQIAALQKQVADLQTQVADLARQVAAKKLPAAPSQHKAMP